MANIITNILCFTGDPARIQELKDTIGRGCTEPETIDFNNIIPTPSHISQGPVPFEKVHSRDPNTWFRWNPENWGCRDNAYGFSGLSHRAGPQRILFQVGWSPPHKVIKRLSEMFPDIGITHLWADGDVGCNCGQRDYLAGAYEEYPFPDGSQEAYEFAASVLDLHGLESEQTDAAELREMELEL